MNKVEDAKKKVDPKISENLLLKIATNNIYSHEELMTIKFTEVEKLKILT